MGHSYVSREDGSERFVVVAEGTADECSRAFEPPVFDANEAPRPMAISYVVPRRVWDEMVGAAR